jgi:NAD(P)-dependent dehydrogenase (short-subunit alcohol dehydrogenase family)
MGRLDGKVAVVTGGTMGIGQGVVLRFLKEGANVVYCSRNPKNNEEMVRLIAEISGAEERAKFIAANVGVKDEIEGVVHEAAKLHGGVDIVINNAQGIAPLLSIEDKPDADYAMTLSTGMYHSLWASKAALPYMKARGGGAVINTSSHWALWGQPASCDYNVTKAAIEILTRSMAREWGPFGITVNCFVPSGDSYAYQAYVRMNPGIDKIIDRSIPMRRMGDCEIDIAGGILGLVSANGRAITGQIIFIDGGTWLARPIQDHATGTDIHAGRQQSASGVVT